MYKLNEIGIPVVEHCNLNCKGCLHFCHIGQEPFFYNINSYIKDIKQLKRFINYIDVIRLYGGEPLLHDDLFKFIDYSKNTFPKSNIEILTNGILITQMNECLVKSIKKNNVKICWSIYPVINDIKFEETIAFLNDNDINYTFTKVEQFYACYDFNGNINKDMAYLKCSGKYCHMLKDGKISCCPAPMVGHHINKFGADVDFTDGMFDIYNATNPSEIIDFLNKPHNACRYCSSPHFFNWELQSQNVSLNDWKI